MQGDASWRTYSPEDDLGLHDGVASWTLRVERTPGMPCLRVWGHRPASPDAPADQVACPFSVSDGNELFGTETHQQLFLYDTETLDSWEGYGALPRETRVIWIARFNAAGENGPIREVR